MSLFLLHTILSRNGYIILGYCLTAFLFQFLKSFCRRISYHRLVQILLFLINLEIRYLNQNLKKNLRNIGNTDLLMVTVK